MPHIVVKLWPGKSEAQKAQLSEALAEALMRVLHYSERSVSVDVEEVASADWADKVYKPDILARWESLQKRPGYRLEDLEPAVSAHQDRSKSQT
ncbi:MAG TPA: tautomerase family protein [Steroidobacteraceae bacterium]|nr:tautomerase family protein [Steroidobacteraceae bacterium]